MRPEEVNASRLECKIPALQEKCRCASVEVLGHMLTVVALAAQRFNLKRYVTKREQLLIAAERKLKLQPTQRFWLSMVL